MGHGHVTPNADGTKARCGGPSICPECALEAGRFGVAYSLQPALDAARAAPHSCQWCPVAVRDLFACAHNAVVNYGTERERKKMADLKDAVESCQPQLDAHFSAFKSEDPAVLRAEIDRLTRERDELLRARSGTYERPGPTSMPGPPERRG